MFEAPQLDEVSKGLLEAANLIKERGWWNGKIQPEERQICAAMAIREIFGDNRRLDCEEAFIRLAKQAGVAVRGDIPLWNDSQDAHTVIRTMQEAAYNHSKLWNQL
jgi:hypothetical protein